MKPKTATKHKRSFTPTEKAKALTDMKSDTDVNGSYTGAPKTVLMTAVKSRQISELKRLVQCIDPNAFMIVQPAHQVLGEGFKRYDDDM